MAVDLGKVVPASRRAVSILGAVALVVLTAGVRGASAQPNILFFLTDDQRHDQLGAAGHPVLQTPTMDRLAAEGTRFTNAFVTTSICAASRASILTGLYERSHRFTFGTPPLRDALVDESYPALLRRAGYRTGFVGKFGVVAAAGATARMFDVFEPLDRNPYRKPQPDGSTRHVTEIAGDRAVAFLRDHDRSRPFALTISFNAPHAEDLDRTDHYPWPAAVDGMYEDVDIPPPLLSSPAVFDAQPDFLKTSLNRLRYFWRWDTPEKYRRNVRGYYRMISGVDRVMGRVLDELERLGLADETVVVFAGDNGYYLGQRGFAGKWSHYDESLRVPIVVFDPRVDEARRGAVDARMALNVDVPATLLEVAGIEPPATYQGRSLLPVVRGEPTPGWRTDFFAEHLMHYPGRIPKWEGVRGERYVYARYFEQAPVFEFLHDLDADPQQLRNLAASATDEHEDVLARMRARTDELRERYGGPFELAETAGGGLVAEPTIEAEGPPNILLIISDDQSWTDFGFMGHDVIRTPHLDRLAAESAVFRRGYVPTALCRPSLATIATGLYAHQHGIVGNDPWIDREGQGPAYWADPRYRALNRQTIARIDDVPTLPRLLEGRGHASFQSGKWWEGDFRRGGFDAGMTHGDQDRGGRHGDEGLAIGREAGVQPVIDFMMRAQADDEPFFVWYAPFLPHFPHDPPERLLARYRAPGRPIELARYYAMCEWFDETVGDLLDYLDTYELARNTLVAFVTDNGWIQRTPATDVPDGWPTSFAPRSKQSPYEGGVRTPIMLRWPGVIAPREVDALASSIDLVPTILAAAGAEAPAGLPGLDLRQIMAGRVSRDTIFGEGFAHDIADVDDPSASLIYRWCIEGRWKLIVPRQGRLGRYAAVHPDLDREPELYDLERDPHETTNRASQQPDVVRRLRAKLDGWWGGGV